MRHAIAACAVLLGLASPASAATWQAPVPYPASGGLAPILVAAGPGGSALIAQDSNADGRTLRVVAADGTVGAASRILAPTSGGYVQSLWPISPLGADGHVRLGATYNDGSYLAQEYHDESCCSRPALLDWTPGPTSATLAPIRVPQASGTSVAGVAVAAGPNGAIAVATSSTSAISLDIDGAAALAVRDASGRTVGRTVRPLRNRLISEPDLRWTPAGPVAAWVTEDRDGNATRLLVAEPGSRRTQAVTLPAPAVTQVVAGDGTVVVLWMRHHRLWQAERSPHGRLGRARVVARTPISDVQVVAGRRSLLTVWTGRQRRVYVRAGTTGGRRAAPHLLGRSDTFDTPHLADDWHGGRFVLFQRRDGAVAAGHIAADGRVTSPMTVAGRGCSGDGLASGGDGTAVALVACGEDGANVFLVRYR